jgi:transglutaminase-like putative cysteine protease
MGQKKKLLLFLAVACAGLFFVVLYAEAADKERVFFLEEKIILKDVPKDAKDISIWIPCPVTDRWQIIEDYRLASVFNTDVITDTEYGNKIFYLSSKKGKGDKNYSEIGLSFKVRRKECYAYDDAVVSAKKLSRFLKPDRLVPVNGEIRALAKKITQDKADKLEKVKVIYDYLINELTYSRDDPRICGLGNSLLTLRHKKGICSDYHSLFISMVRSLGIPAKFEIGFRLPEETKEGKISGYHCWAKFYLKGKGWIPVDISEADKHPERENYFFGHIDENKVNITTGRDIRIEYARNTEPLNFFVYPYIEVNGLPFDGMEVEVSFRDLKEKGKDG